MPRLNYTGRKRIFREHVQIQMVEVREGSYKPDMQLELESYGFPASAEISLELNNRESLWRRSFGTVGSPGFSGPRVISPLSAAVPLYARLKVINRSSGTARILGLMRKTRIFGESSPVQGSASRSFVEVEPADLGEQVWALDIPNDEEEFPVIQVNKRIPNARAMVMDPLFRSAVMPMVLERILERIMIGHGFRDFESSSPWGQILTYADRIVSADSLRGLPEGAWDAAAVGSIIDWIQEVARVWCSDHRFSTIFDASWNKGVE